MNSLTAPDTIVSDTKDWTWVLTRPCPDCGFDASAHAVADLPRLLHDTAMVWSQALRGADVAILPGAGTWSPLEYACHVRDVHQIFADRVRSVLDQDIPTFSGWDQDRAADEPSYAEQEPSWMSN